MEVKLAMMMELRGKTAFVAGSTQGVGRAIALKFAEHGADIILNGRNPSVTDGLIEQIELLGRRVIFEKADITLYREIKEAVDSAFASFGRIDILVASGGRRYDTSPNYFHETDPDSFEAYAKTQWLSRLNCAKAVLPYMKLKQSGKIIFITTDAGRWPTPVEAVAGGAGAAVVMATKVLAQEFARWNIRVNAISLPPIKNTPAYEIVSQLSGSIAHLFDKALAKQPFPVTTDDVAETALFFASEKSNAITGQILSVNGGLSFPG
jgi:2-hydroxycyclohexanecarboxyl-CoA dehydrogenase